MKALYGKEYAKAVVELGTASELKPSDLAYRRDWLRAKESATEKLLEMSQAALADGDRQRAAHTYQSILQYDRDNERARAGLDKLATLSRAEEDATAARTALKGGDVARAAELTGRALRAAPAHAAALALKAELDALQTQELLAEPTLGAIYKKPINLEFRDAGIKLVFDALSRSTGINFIFDRDVRLDQRTTVFLKQTSIDDAIGVILATAQLEKKVLNPTSVLIYPSSQSKQREYQELVVRAFYLSNVEAKQTATLLRTVLKIKDAFVDDKYNMIVLREPPETIALAERLIRLHDLEEPEVMLDVEVLEINRSRLLNAGIQWSNQFTLSPLSITGGTQTGTSTAPATMKLSDLRNLSSSTLGITAPSATVNLQKIDGDANLLANPRIRVRDREKAKIMIGDKVPVVTTTSTNTFVTENIQYLDVGLKLEVEPDIHLRDEVGLKIGLEVSSLVSTVKTNNGSQAYQIGTRNFSSALRLKDGETQVLAGLISDEERASANRIPLLGDIPLLGRLFGSQNDNHQKTEIVLSITPHLVRNLQRKDVASEAFWSGTEATLRNRPIALREMSSTPSVGDTKGSNVSISTRARAQEPVVPSPPGSPKLSWRGPEHVKVGSDVRLDLQFDSVEALRAASLQLAYQSTDFELVSVEAGDYFGKGGKGSFSKSHEPASGRLSVGMHAGDGTFGSGKGVAVSLTLRALRETLDSEVGIISFTPVGAEKAIVRPSLPIVHRVAISR
jgi:general secretion pathway protein D